MSRLCGAERIRSSADHIQFIEKAFGVMVISYFPLELIIGAA